MKKIVIPFILVLFYINSAVYSQKISSYSQPLKERIFLNYNASLFLTEERLFYKVYCIKAVNNRFSNLSKVAYVELIDSNKNIIFKHKIKLKDGIGDGSFFIPKSVLSGNFKLIAYTQWMRNEGNSYFFQGDVTIVNTFLNNQNLTLKETNNSITDNTIAKISKAIVSKNDFLELKLNRKDFNKREKIVLEINSLDNQKAFGNYSISVRKIDFLEKPKQYSPENYVNLYLDSASVDTGFNSENSFLPESMGEILTGQVLFKGTKKPVQNVMVLLSSPTGKYPLRFATTNSLGSFEFIFKEIREEPNVIVQVFNKNRENYSISLNNQKPLDYNSLIFKEFEVYPNSKELLLEYSIQNQIENAYLSEKFNLISNRETNQYDTKLSTAETYILDDYNRFATVRETVIEVINNVWITRKKDDYTFHVRNKDVFDQDKHLPLVLVDGILIQNHSEIVDYGAKFINKITLERDKLFYKSFAFIGIITMQTFEGNYNKNLSKDYIVQHDLFVPLRNENVFVQEYNTNKFDKIPDYRRQLYWLPKFELNRKENKITFYTSDVSGDYEVCIEGFTKQGLPVFLKEVFSVK